MKAKLNMFEIEESMAQLLAPQYIEKQASSNNAAEAMVSLLKAAEIFENLEMFAAAEVITKVLESASSLRKSKIAVASVFRITTKHVDGEHELADGVKTYEEAKATAEKWLGGANYWADGGNKNPARPMRAITYGGGVLLIEERPVQLTPFAEKVWRAVQYSWSTHEDDLFRNANELKPVDPQMPWYDPNNPNEPKDEHLYELLGGASKEDIAVALDELLEGGFITGKELDVDRRAEQERKLQERARTDPEWAKSFGAETVTRVLEKVAAKRDWFVFYKLNGKSFSDYGPDEEGYIRDDAHKALVALREKHGDKLKDGKIMRTDRAAVGDSP